MFSGLTGGHNPISHVKDHSRRRSSTTGSNKSTGTGSDTERGDSEEETVVDDSEKNVLLSIISQLRPGADLSRITLPTFILEPRSMLQRITNFMQHPETLLPMTEIDDPEKRFVSVVKFYLSGWHIKPAGVKKPLNPILGEFFTCYWNLDGSPSAFYIAEQTSHHPPKSSYFYMAPYHHIRIDGTLKPQSRFLGNSAASMMNTSLVVLTLMNKGLTAGQPGGGEKYLLTQPNMYVRGILFGKMKYELGDHSYVRCPELDLVCDIEFKVKGFFTGAYNAIGGYIKRDSTGEQLYEISGSWNAEMFIRNCRTGKRGLLFDATHMAPTPPCVRPIAEQEDRESERLWEPVVSALIKKDQERATDAKFEIENRQREEARTRDADGVEWKPRYFREVRPGQGEEEGLDYILAAHIDGTTPEEQIKQILSVAPILGGTKRASKYDVPPLHHQDSSSTSTNDGAADPHSHPDHQDSPHQAKLVDAQEIDHQRDQPPLPVQSDSDLIDFDPQTSAQRLNSFPALVPTDKGVSKAGRTEDTESRAMGPGTGGGLEDMKELQKALGPGKAESVTSEDEFVDAQEDH